MRLVGQTLIIDDVRSVVLTDAQVRIVSALLNGPAEGIRTAISPYARERNGPYLFRHLRAKLRKVGADIDVGTHVVLVDHKLDSYSVPNLGTCESPVTPKRRSIAKSDPAAIDAYRDGRTSLSEMLDALYPATTKRAG